MAKKSAASKGFRRSAKKKPFLTTQEIIILVVIVAAILAAVVLFNLFYGNSYLKASDVKENDVVSMVSSDLKTRYVKVADANELEGFTRANPYREVNVASNFEFTPDEPTENIDTITLGGSFLEAAQLADTNSTQVQALSSSTSTQRYDTTVQGHDAYVYGYTNSYYQKPQGDDADADEPETDEDGNPLPNVFSQAINLYVNAGDHTVTFHIYRSGEDDSFFLADDEIVDYVLGYANEAFTVYEEPET